jgi:peptide/nickel transport system permease protein
MSQQDLAAWGGLSRQQSQTRLFVRQFIRNRMAVAGFIVAVGLVLMAFFAPWIAPQDPALQVYTEVRQPPSAQHPFGTDDLGRDQLSRVIYGARASLPVGVFSMAFASSLGVLLGLISGYYGRRVDTVIMRIMDMLLAFPGLLLAIFMVAVLGPSLRNAVLGIVIVGIPGFARVTRANVLSIKEEEYTVAARSIGASDRRLMLRHILLNAMSPVIVQVSLGIARAILLESSLSFLGLGVQPPTPAWGSMIAEGRTFITQAWWMSAFPGLAIFLTVISFNFIGDGLREAFDPRQRRR